MHLRKDPDLEKIKGVVGASKTTGWTIESACELGVPIPIISTSLMMRLRSKQDDSFSAKVIASLRDEVGGQQKLQVKIKGEIYMWFYKIERDEKNKNINITWNTTMTYIKSILGVVGVGACLFNLVWLAAICLTILAVALTYYLYRYGNLVRILHSHEQKKGLEYTGSQYSFKDPLIVTIPQVRNI